MEEQNFWKRCSCCKKEIAFESIYYLCSVSTCRHPRTGLRFCSVACWDAHLGYANHKSSAWAEEMRSPDKASYQKTVDEAGTTRAPVRKIVDPRPSPSITPIPRESARFEGRQDLETLVVVSKIKSLIAKESSFSTSQCCIDALTKKVAESCRQAIEHARAAGRKTVMGRDVR